MTKIIAPPTVKEFLEAFDAELLTFPDIDNNGELVGSRYYIGQTAEHNAGMYEAYFSPSFNNIEELETWCQQHVDAMIEFTSKPDWGPSLPWEV